MIEIPDHNQNVQLVSRKDRKCFLEAKHLRAQMSKILKLHVIVI